VIRGHDDYRTEPIRGLPETPPPGERILWQGSPRWWQLAKDVFHVRAVAIYLTGLMAWRVSVRMADTDGIHAAVVSVLSLLPMAMIALGLLGLLAWLCCRTTVYTITNRRVVFRIGVALPTAINIPFGVIGAADLRPRARGAGDIALALLGSDRLAYSHLWPHVRPWRFAAPAPTLRAIPDAAHVATILAAALGKALPSNSVHPLPAAMDLMDAGKAKATRAPAAFGLSASLGASS
jgi:hypothetical protein